MISYEEMQLEYAKCYMDKTRKYFIEHYLETFNATEGRKGPFVLFPRQIEYLKNISENEKNISLKPRQAGITTVTSAWVTGQCVFATKDSPETVLCIGNKLDLAQQLITKMREFLLQVPRWFWGDEYYSVDPKSEKLKKDIFIKNSKNELELFNGCKVVARSSGENAARGVSSVSVLILDESAFIENAMSVYTSALAATASVVNRKIILISTPNGHDELYYNTYKQALGGTNGFKVSEFRWYQDPRYNRYLTWRKKDEATGDDLINEDTVIDHKGNIVYDEERWRKLIKEGWKPSSPWYENMRQSFNNDPKMIAQELDVSFEGSANNVVAPEFIEMQATYNVCEPLENFKDPLVEEMWFWKEPIEGHRYILAADPSKGVSADNTAIEIIDMDGRDENGMPILEQVAEYVGRKLADDIGGMVYQYARLYNDAYVIVDDTGGVGSPVVLTLLQMGYTNLYYDDAVQKTYTVQNSTKQLGQQYSNKLPGFHFQGNRYPVLASFAGMVRNNEFKIRSVRVINELETWIFKGDIGRMDHQEGAHDDTLTALAMGLFVLRFSVNKIQEIKNKDKAILNAYRVNSTFKRFDTSYAPPKSVDIRSKYETPLYQAKKSGQFDHIQGNYMWLFSK